MLKAGVGQELKPSYHNTISNVGHAVINIILCKCIHLIMIQNCEQITDLHEKHCISDYSIRKSYLHQSYSLFYKEAAIPLTHSTHNWGVELLATIYPTSLSDLSPFLARHKFLLSKMCHTFPGE